jgi:hypothetical protein
MKTVKILVVILVFSANCFSQTKQKEVIKTTKDTIVTDTTKVKKNNLLDMQSEFLTSTFGENLDGKSNGKKISFLELLDQMDMPAEQKAEYRNWFYLQAKDLTEKQKDSLGKAIEIKIKEAQVNNTKN